MYRPGIDDPRQGPRAAWAQLSGALDLETFPRDVVEAEERAAIDLLLGRYVWAIDERLPGLLGDCFASDAILERRIEEESGLPVLAGRATIVAAYRDGWSSSSLGQSRRYREATLIGRVDERRALVLSKWLVTATNEVGSKLCGTGFDLAEVAREGGPWQITRLLVGYDRPLDGRVV